MGGLAQPVIQLINQYVGPYALIGEAFPPPSLFRSQPLTANRHHLQRVGSGPRHDLACLGRDDRLGHPRAREPLAPTFCICFAACQPASISPREILTPATRHLKYFPTPTPTPSLTFAPLHRSPAPICTFALPLPYLASQQFTMPAVPPLHPVQPINSGSLPVWVFAALPAAGAATFALLTTHNPLTRAITLGADLAKEQALKAIPQEWMGGLAQPVIQLINQYVGPYALIGEAFMGTWAILLTLALPAAFLLLGFIIVHGGLLLGGAPGGWKGTARAFLINHACADLATLAWAGFILALKLSLVSQCLLLLGGLLLIRLIAHSWLLISLAQAHSLGALRIIFLGLPALLFALAVSSLVTTALWTWLVADLALAASR